MYVYIGFKTFFYVVQHLDSITSYIPTGLHLGFFLSWPSLFLPSSFASVFLVLPFVSACICTVNNMFTANRTQRFSSKFNNARTDSLLIGVCFCTLCTNLHSHLQIIRHWTMFWARLIQSTHFHKMSLMTFLMSLSVHTYVFKDKFFHFKICPRAVTCPANFKIFSSLIDHNIQGVTGGTDQTSGGCYLC